MKDDTSALTGYNCFVYYGDNHIRGYSPRQYSDYYLIGDKWTKTQTQTSGYNDYNYSNYECLDVSSLSSRYSYMFPIYEIINLALVFGLFAFIYILVIRPFMKKGAYV